MIRIRKIGQPIQKDRKISKKEIKTATVMKFEAIKEFPINESDAAKIKPLRNAPPVPQMI